MYTNLGGLPVIPAADLLNMQSSANKPGVGNSRIGSSPYVMGKEGGDLAFRDAGSGALSLVFATGSLPSSAWRAADGSASYTPLNLSTFTPAAGCTYAAGLLTADGVDDPTATQTITSLAAGTYIVSGEAACEGPSAADVDAPKLVITGATDGVLLSKVFTAARHATAAESASPKEAFAYSFTLTVAQNVTVALSNVNEAGSLEAGSSYILLNPLEARA